MLNLTIERSSYDIKGGEIMNKVESNKYYINGSKIKISLEHYDVEVDRIILPYNRITIPHKRIYYEMTINDTKGEQTKLNFNSLEEAINFIESKVKNSPNILEIINTYNNTYINTHKDSNKKL